MKSGLNTVPPMTGYRPVSCAFRDRLEQLALRQSPCRLRFRHHGRDARAEGVITDIVTADGGEFLLLGKTGERIRLDAGRDVQPLG